jgi:hypothetical protein
VAELDPFVVEGRDEGAGLEVGRAVERHVLDEVGHALLGVGLDQAAEVHVQAEEDLLLRLGVVHPDVAEAVLERAEVEARIGLEVGGVVLPLARLDRLFGRLHGLRLGRGGDGEQSDEAGRDDRAHDSSRLDRNSRRTGRGQELRRVRRRG